MAHGRPDQDSDPADGFIDGVYINLGALGEAADSRGLNDLVQVVGDSASFPSFWDPSLGMMESLENFGLGNGAAHAVTDIGLIAGFVQDTTTGEQTALIWEAPVMSGIDVGVAGGGFRSKGRVRCPSQCEQNITIKLKNYSDRLARIAYGVTSAPSGPDLSNPDCAGVTGFLNPRETISVVGCTVTYTTKGNFTLTLSVEPRVGTGEGLPVEDIDLTNNSKGKAVKVL